MHLKNLLLSIVGLSSAEPFWKYDRPERFVKWATEAIPQIIAEGVSDPGVKLHNIGDVELEDLVGAKGLTKGTLWSVQAIYTNADSKYKFYCIIHLTKGHSIPDKRIISCEKYRF